MIPRRPTGRQVLWAVAATALCTTFALRAVPGFVRHATGYLTPEPKDSLLNLVLLKWGAHQWRLGLPDYWNANFFFPARGVVALSDHLVGPSLFFAGLTSAGVAPVMAYNALLLFALAASPLSLFLLLRRLGASDPGAVVGALAWGFAAYRLSHVAHLQLLLAFWIPPLLWAFDRLLERPRASTAVCFGLFYALHLSGGSYLAYMVHVPLAAILVVRRRELWRALRRRPEALWIFAAGAFAALVAGSLYGPYVRHSRALGVSRTAYEAGQFGVTWGSFAAAAPDTALEREEARRRKGVEHRCSPGVVALLLASIGGIAARPRGGSPLARAILGGALACLALSFAPVFVGAAKVLPGLTGMRVPARFVQLAGLGLALLAARGFDVLRDRIRHRTWRAALAVSVLAALGAELLPSHAKWGRVGEEADFPAVDKWIATQPTIRAYVDLPFPPEERVTREYVAMYLSTLHWKGLVNGHSGYSTALWRELFEAIPFMPDQSALSRLRDLGVTHVVVRESKMRGSRWRREAWSAWRESFEREGFAGLDRIYRDDAGGWVFRISPEA